MSHPSPPAPNVGSSPQSCDAELDVVLDALVSRRETMSHPSPRAPSVCSSPWGDAELGAVLFDEETHVDISSKVGTTNYARTTCLASAHSRARIERPLHTFGKNALMIGIAMSLLCTVVACSVCLYFWIQIGRLRQSEHLDLGAPCPFDIMPNPSDALALSEPYLSGALSGPDLSGALPGHFSYSDAELANDRRKYWPEMYGKVPEKTIWTFWYNEDMCPSSTNCTLPAVVQLCVETVEKNRGSFDYRIIHRDQIEKYISRIELPIHFSKLRPAQQKDALMNALLARYGGVALDITSLLFRPFDDYWNEMVAKKATFRGYMYRYNGMQWGNSEATVVWFLMSRREGIFNSAVRSQVIGMGDWKVALGMPEGYHNPYFALGDQTLLPILSEFNYSLPKCSDDGSVGPPVSWPNMCPDLEFNTYNVSVPGPERNDMRIMLREPRDGPQLPFAFLDDFSMGLWHVDGPTKVNSGIPPRCDTHKECWDVFMERYMRTPAPGETREMEFIKMFGSAGNLKGKTREQLLADKDTYFYHWLLLAGLDV